MSYRIGTGLFIMFITGLFSSASSAEGLQVGQLAPTFSLSDQYGENHTLEQYRGQWVLLYFYPKDDTPGCTEQACGLRDDILQLQQLKVKILGVSLDSKESHALFAEKYGLPYPLLADENGQVAEAYQTLFKLGPLKYARRHTFIIDPEGHLSRIYRDVDPKTHSSEVIAAIKSLQVNTD